MSDPNRNECSYSEKPNSSDLISRQEALKALRPIMRKSDYFYEILKAIQDVPPADPERRYTVEELRVFRHGISLSLLSKRSSQHWKYDEDTAKEIEFLEQLYKKVDADMRGEENG